MVLRDNFARRLVNENAAPTDPTTKSLAARIRTSIHDAARRRRARTSVGGTASHSNSKYAVEQAKRRSTTTKSPSSSFRVNVIRQVQTDTDMKDAASPSFSVPSSRPRTTPVRLPRELARPAYCEVSRDAICAVDPLLVHTDMEYIREQLEELGPGMLRVLSTVKASPERDSLPKELAIVVQDFASALPTHMFAVYGAAQPRTDTKQRRRVTLYPVHSLVFASYCSKLPPFPSSHCTLSTDPPSRPPLQLQVPVRPLCLPSPQTYPHLSSFLYTKRADVLLNSLMPPCLAPLGPLLEDDDDVHVHAYATKLAETFTVQVLLGHTLVVHGLWQNVCALGVFDDLLWDSMDLAWKILLTALAVSTGNPQMMMVTA